MDGTGSGAASGDGLVQVIAALALLFFAAPGASGPIDIAGWEKFFARHYDYTLVETAGLERTYEPIEVTLSMPVDQLSGWRQHVRVVRLESNQRGVLVPHQIAGGIAAAPESTDTAAGPAPAANANLIFLAHCAAHSEVTYRLFWGLPEAPAGARPELPQARAADALQISGTMPGLSIRNEYYAIRLDARSGAIEAAARMGLEGAGAIDFFQRERPIHFGVDVWSPPDTWDHDHDWQRPPNQNSESGPLALRYRRWGPMPHYRDVLCSITYTFYAHVPYVHVETTLEFTRPRSVRAIRMGEIVATSTRKPLETPPDAAHNLRDVFSHFAWPLEDGSVFSRRINAHRDPEGWADIDGMARGALAILERDIPWIAAYSSSGKYGIASLRKAQFAGNRRGGPVVHSAPCTYVANYGWGFSYWSRPMVFPMGEKGTALDRNLAVAAGTLYATDEALLIFAVDPELDQVRRAHLQFTRPLRFRFAGTGPW